MTRIFQALFHWLFLLISGTDSDYKRFLETLQNPEPESSVSIDTYLEELEERERQQKGETVWQSFSCTWHLSDVTVIIFLMKIWYWKKRHIVLVVLLLLLLFRFSRSRLMIFHFYMSKASSGNRLTTPLLEFLKRRKEERKTAFLVSII